MDAKAWYYMDNFRYGSRQYHEAAKCWEKSKSIDDSFRTVHRNLALAYYNKKANAEAAQISLEKAKEAWQHASEGLSEPNAALYNDQQADKIFYQGMALIKLERNEEAHHRFNKLLEFGEKNLLIPFKMDYFAVSLPDLLILEEDLQKQHEQHCHYLMALEHLGLGNNDKAIAEFKKVLSGDICHIGKFKISRVINSIA